MKHNYFKLLILVCCSLLSLQADAQFSGEFAPSNWTLTSVSPSSDASTDISNTPTSITFNGNDSSSGGFFGNLYDDYSIIIPNSYGSVNLSFDWFFENPDIERFYYIVNGKETLVSNITDSGTLTIPVNGGDQFAFRIWTGDDCCGRGVLTISNFKVGPSCNLTASITSQANVTCNGNATGSLTVAAENGTANYSYSWSNGSSVSNTTSDTNTISDLAAGTYEVTITDKNGCQAKTTATITEPTILSGNVIVESNASCESANDGALKVDVTGGTGSYTYLWSNGVKAQITENLYPGNYTVTVTDSNGCEVKVQGEVVVEDTVEPEVVTKDINLQLDDSGVASLTPAMVDNNSSDNCTDITELDYSVYPNSFSCNDISSSVISLKGNDDYVKLPGGMLENVSDFTFEGWVNNTEERGWSRVFDFSVDTNTNMFLTLSSGINDNQPAFIIKKDGDLNAEVINSSISLTNGWHYIAVTLDEISSGNVVGKLYIDGKLTGENNSMSLSPQTLGSTPNNYLGKSAYPADPNFVGEMRNIRFWNVAKTHKELIELGQSKNDILEPELIAYYKFENNAEPSVISDSGESNNNAELLNSDSSAYVSSAAPQQVILSITDSSGNTSIASAIVTLEDTMAPELICPEDVEEVSGLGPILASYPMTDDLNDSTGNFAPIDLEGKTSLPVFDAASGSLCQNGVYILSDGGQNVDFPKISTLDPTDFSFGLEFKLTELPSTDYFPILIGGTSYRWLGILVNSSGELGIKYNNSFFEYSSTKVDPDQWFSVRIKYSSNTAKLYLNNKLILSKNTGELIMNSDFNFSTTDFSSGKSLNGCIRSFNVNDLIGAEGDSGSYIEYDKPKAIDNCDTDVSITQKTGLPSGSIFPVGTTTNTFEVLDVSGNKSTCSFDVTIVDADPPVGYSVSIDQAQIDGSNVTSASFTLSNAEIGTTYNYNISSSGGGTEITGSGTVVTAADQVTGIDVRGLEDGILTLSVILTDVYGNTGTAATDTVEKDATTPSGYVVSIDQDLINDSNQTSASFTFANAEVGTNYNYTISSAGGGTEITGSGTIKTAEDQITGIDVSGLEDGILNLSVTLTDDFGNTGSVATDSVTKDATAPTVITKDVTVQLNDNGKVVVTAADINNDSNDAYGIATMSVAPDSFTCDEIGKHTVTLTVKDTNGNTSEATATVTVEDKVAPKAIAQNITVELDENGAVSITTEMIDNNSSDACGIKSLSLRKTDFGCKNIGENAITLSVEDKNGNISEATATVTVEDNFTPKAIAQNITVELDENGAVSITPEMINNNSSDACGIKSLKLSKTDFGCENVGENTVVLTVEDVNGNTSEATATVTVQDNTAPKAIAQNITVELNEDGAVSITPEMIDNNSNDACGIKSLSLSKTEFSCANVGENTVTLTVEDENGNISEATAVVTVEDNNAPVASAKALTVELDEFGTAVISPEMIDNGSNDACGIESLELDITEFTCDMVGVNTVVLSVTDLNGNVSTASAKVTVEDNIAPVPVMEKLENITAECLVEESDVVAPLAIDNCDGEIKTTHNVDFPITKQGTTIITWTFEDENSNIATQTQQVILKDVTAPVADVAELEDLVVQCGISDIDAPTASDICADSITGTTTDPLNYNEEGEYVITWTYDDGNGNTSAQTQKVIVKDTTAPEVLTRDVTVYLDPEENVRITTADVDAGSFDNCSQVSLSLNKDYFAYEGVYEVVLSVTDASGNTAEGIAKVTVETENHPNSGKVHVVPTILRNSSRARVIIPFRHKIAEVQVMETETNKYKMFKGNKANQMEIDIAPFKGTLLVRIIDLAGNVHLKKLIAL